MTYIIDIPCQSANIGGEQREAVVETTLTGVRWTIRGKLAEAIRNEIARREEAGKDARVPLTGWSNRAFSDDEAAGHPRYPIAPAPTLVERLRYLVSLNEPSKGGPYQGHAAQMIVSTMTEAADQLERMETVLSRTLDVTS